MAIWRGYAYILSFCSLISICSRKNIADETLDKIPLFRIVEAYLEILLRNKGVELTPAGALPQGLLREIYDKRYITDPFIDEGVSELITEANCLPILSACLTANVAELLETVGNKNILTARGSDLTQPQKRAALFVDFFKAFTNDFPWTILDDDTEKPLAQIGLEIFHSTASQNGASIPAS